MQPRRLTVRGMTPYRGEQTIDFDALQGPLVAVVGPNGAGKSTLLELIHAAFYRHLPTRGTLASLATDRDSSLELDFVHEGRELTVRHLVDGISGRSAVYLDGAPELTTGKVSEYRAWMETHLPSEAVALASLFAAQGAAGFLGATAGERKGILLRALGHDRLERLSAAASERARGLRCDLAAVNASIAVLGPVAEVADPAVAEASLTEAQGAVDESSRTLQETRGLVVVEREVCVPLRREHAARVVRLAEMEAKLVLGDERLAAIRARVEAAPDAPDSVALDQARFACAAASAAAERSQKASQEAHAERATLHANHRVAEAEAHRAQGAWEKANAMIEKARAEAPDAEEVGRLRSAWVDLCTSTVLLQERIDALRESRVDAAATRIGRLRGGLLAVDQAEALADAGRAAALTLREDDELAEAIASTPARLQAMEAKLYPVDERRMAAKDAFDEAEQRVRRLEVVASTIDLDALDAAAADAAAREEAAHEASADAAQAATHRLVEARADAEKLRDCERKRDALQAQAAAAAAVEADRGRLAEAGPRREQLAADIAALRADIEGAVLPAPWPRSETPAEWLRLAEDLVDAAKAERHRCETHLADVQRRANEAREARARLDALTAERVALEEQLGDATSVALDLGRDGLQALELDAAGPELSTLATDLLHRAFGPRWTVSFETLRSSSDGKRDLETLEVRVLDTHTGYEGPAEALSGGERAIVGEAVSLALTVLACRSARIQRPTLIRDETGAALDPEKVEAYVRMLRVAAELVGAARILFVSHDPRAAELADSRIEIADGVIACATTPASAQEAAE